MSFLRPSGSLTTAFGDGTVIPVCVSKIFLQSLKCCVCVCSRPVRPSAVMTPSNALGVYVRLHLGLPAVEHARAVAHELDVRERLAHLLDERLRPSTPSPARISASTFSVRHRSMKLSSCDCAAVVSEPVSVTMPVGAALDAHLLQRGLDHVRDRGRWRPTRRARRPSCRRGCDSTASSDITTRSLRSFRMSGVSSRPGGALATSSCVRS